MKKALIVLLPLALLCFVCATRMDGFIDSLKSKLAAYQQERPFANLYVHLDKNVYLTNESIWFKAYLLTEPGPDDKVLYVRLTDKAKSIVLNYQFPLKDIRANGDILLPDTLHEGEYYFYAFTNHMVNLNPNCVFVQKIKLFKTAAETMQAEAAVTDSTKLHRGGNIDILIKIKKGGTYVTDTKGSYQLLVDDKPIKAGKVTTNFLGEAFISFTYPQIADDKTVQVKAVFNKDADRAELNLNLRHEASPVVIRAFPEGGHLIAGIVNRVSIEAGDSKNNPLSTDLLFKNGDKLIAKLRTNAYGVAQLRFVPQTDAHYTFEVVGNGNKTPIALSAPVEASGFGLRVWQQGKQYEALITNHSKSDSATLVLRSYDEILWNQNISVKPGDSTLVTLPVNDVPKQILSVAVFDSHGACAAERLFMYQKPDDYHITIQTEKTSYGLRQKVKVTINAANLTGDPVKANLSVAVVEKSRISNSYNTILDALYYKPLSQTFPDQHYSGTSAEDLDAILMTKKWWYNNWNDILNYKPNGFVRTIQNTDGVAGIITRNNGKPVDLKQIFVFYKKGFVEVQVDPDGRFYIPSEVLIADRSDKRYLMLNQDFYYKYKITFANYEDEYDKVVKFTDALKFLEPYNTFVKLNDNTGLNLKGKIQLKEVKISDRGSNEPIPMTDFRSTTCNDWVCLYNILNCRNHPYGSIPVDGGVYIYHGVPVVYHSCGNVDQSHFLLKNISLPNNFILPDYDKQPSDEPELRSTVYWNPNLNTDMYGKVSFEFYTSDIKGDFTIMVQGIDARTFNPVYATGGFGVK